MTEKEKTAPVVSVGADTEQSILKQINNSITDFNENDKSLDDYFEEMQKELKEVPIISATHLNDGLMRIQLCGSPTGDANVYEIEETYLDKAKSLGFREWTFSGNTK